MFLNGLSDNEILTFFAVLVRYSMMLAVLPIVGDRVVPMPVRVLLSLSFAVVLFPVLVAGGVIRPGEASSWGSTAAGIGITVATEAVFGLLVGFSARMIFDAIQIGGTLVGTFMGLSAASLFDPHQESQSQTVAQVQMTIATLIFLAMDGHHLMLRSALNSYQVIGVGEAHFGQALVEQLLVYSGEMIRLGLQLAAPMALSLFAVNVVYGIIARAMPQLNVLVLSFSVSALVGLFVLFISLPEFESYSATLFESIGGRMDAVMASMQH